MRVLVLGVALLVVGYVGAQLFPTAAIGNQQADKQQADEVVRVWVNEIPLLKVWGYAIGLDPADVQKDSKFDVDRWLEKGKKNPNTVPALQRMLRENNLKAYLPAAAFALGKLGACESVPALIACLDRDDMELQRKAMEALGRIGDRRAVDALVARLTLLIFNDLNTQRPLTAALASIGDEACERCLDLACNSMNVELADTAREALAELRRKRGTATPSTAKDEPSRHQKLVDHQLELKGWRKKYDRGAAILKELSSLSPEDRKTFDIQAYRDETVVFDGGAAPPGSTNDLIAAGGFYLRVVTKSGADLRPHATAWAVLIHGKIQQVLPEHKLIIIEVDDYWVYMTS